MFDTVNNAPGLLQPTVQWGLLQNLTGGASDPYPALGMQPTAYDFKPPKVYAVERRHPAQAVARTSRSTSPTSARARRT